MSNVIPLNVGKRTTRTGTETTKVRNSDIPEDMREQWARLVVPLARELAGTLQPWASLDVSHVQSVIDRVYPQSGYIVRKGDVLYTLLSYRITDWRSSIGSGGTTLVEQMITDNKNVLMTANDIREWVSYELGDGGQHVPFHWRKWNNQKKSGKGVYEHDLILATLATTYIAEIERIPANLRSTDYPVGALVLAIQAVERGLKLHASGEKVKSDTGLWFSEDNWGNVVRMEGGKPKQVNRASKYLNVINNWKPEKWSALLDSARKLYKEVQPTQKGHSAAQPIEVEEQEETYFIASGSDSE
ncbi:hypothetical protein QCA50_015533 [Cerrena zonata]|uniref:DUF6532 domain-containing protein n=1 Tax=Cerrena zonata TaxID=2478898 RepID=A0AAW0FLE6_9APHY